jgi:uncharacterized linocin/CFP29 family protein
MSEVKYYDGEYKDIIVSIPTNTVHATIDVAVYEDGGIFEGTQELDLEGIKYAEDLFEQCCDGEYPQYTLTEKGKEYFEGLLKDKVE